MGHFCPAPILRFDHMFDFEYPLSQRRSKTIGQSSLRIGAGLRLKLGLFWVRFSHVDQVSFFHNPLLITYLRSFDFFGIWVRFAKKSLICKELSTVVKMLRLAKYEIRSSKSSTFRKDSQGGHLAVETISKSKLPKFKTLPFLPNNGCLACIISYCVWRPIRKPKACF